MRFIVLVLLTIAMPYSASAECADEFRSAIQKFYEAGPFHYVSVDSGANYSKKRSGVIDLQNKTEHRIEVFNGSSGRETIAIDHQWWTKDELGWGQPAYTFEISRPEFPVKLFAVSAQTCSLTSSEAPSIKRYDFKPMSKSDTISNNISVDQSTGMIVGYEIHDSSPTGGNVISTYRHDPSIKIEAPTVDMTSRIAQSTASFKEAIAKSDSACRDTVKSIIRNSLAKSFQYKIEGGMHSGVFGMHGIFVPPDSLYYAIDGVPYHGGGSETISIANQWWLKHAGGDWATIEPSPNAQKHANAVSQFFEIFNGDTEHQLGATRCPESKPEPSSQTAIYEYDVYRDGSSGPELSIRRRIYVDLGLDAPIKLERLNSQEQVIQSETRTYDSTLKIYPPTKHDK
jgi:hypothetical protein